MNKYSLSFIGSVVCVAVVAVAAPRLIAQAGQPTRVTVIGCIKPNASTPNADMTIRDYRGGPAPTFRLTGEAEQLKLNVNQTVEVSGALTAAAPGSPADVPTLKVEKLHRVATSCWPSQGGK